MHSAERDGTDMDADAKQIAQGDTHARTQMDQR